MATLASLGINLFAGTANFISGMTKAEKKVTGFQGAVNKLQGTMRGLGTALIAGFTLRSFISGIDRTINKIDELGDLAERVGGSVEAISKLQFAARFSDVDAELFNTSLERMSKRIGELKTEGGKTAERLKAFGIDINRLAQLSPERAFLELADAVSKVDNNFVQAAIATEFFSRSGVKLLNILRKGRPKIEALGEEGVRRGAVVGEREAEGAGRADEAIKRLSDRGTQFWRIMTVGLSEFVEGAANISDFILDTTSVHRRLRAEHELLEEKRKMWREEKKNQRAERAGQATSLTRGILAAPEFIAKGFKAAITFNDQMAAAVKTRNELVAEGIFELEREAEVVGMSAEQIKRLRLEQLNLSDAERKRMNIALEKIQRGPQPGFFERLLSGIKAKFAGIDFGKIGGLLELRELAEIQPAGALERGSREELIARTAPRQAGQNELNQVQKEALGELRKIATNTGKVINNPVLEIVKVAFPGIL